MRGGGSGPVTCRAAFFRGINLGKRRVKMADLRAHLEAMGLEDVETFLASGNATFSGGAADAEALEAGVEAHLEEALGFHADTFVRTAAELEALLGRDDVEAARAEGFTPYVTFLKEPAGEGVRAALAELETPDDRFVVAGREVFWLRRGRLSDSPVKTRHLEEAFGGPNTRRKLDTVARVVGSGPG